MLSRIVIIINWINTVLCRIYNWLISPDIDIETKITKISSIMADIVNCIIFISLGLFYYLSPFGSGFLFPLLCSSGLLFLMIQGYVKESKIICSIYLVLSAIFYLSLSTYVILYNLVLTDIPDHVVYVLLFKMNIPTLIMGFATILNAVEIEKEVLLNPNCEMISGPQDDDHDDKHTNK